MSENALPPLEYGGTLQTRVGGGGDPPRQKLTLRPGFRGYISNTTWYISKAIGQQETLPALLARANRERFRFCVDNLKNGGRRPAATGYYG